MLGGKFFAGIGRMIINRPIYKIHKTTFELAPIHM
jgi:hypothetical protein